MAGLLAVPYFVTRGVLPYMGLSANSLHVRSRTSFLLCLVGDSFHCLGQAYWIACWLQVCWVWAYFVEVIGLLLVYALHFAMQKARQLRRALFEEKFLIGRRVNNLVDTPTA